MRIKYTKINYTLKTMKNLHSELFCEKTLMCVMVSPIYFFDNVDMLTHNGLNYTHAARVSSRVRPVAVAADCGVGQFWWLLIIS